MIVARTVADLRRQLVEWGRPGRTVGLVPTMGAMHDGHLELVRRARAACDIVVLTIFVNPGQFDGAAAHAAYPRPEQLDLELAAAAGVDLAFLPSVSEVYPPGFTASVALHGPLAETLEAAARGVGHYVAITTVTAKLFNMVGADRIYFGQKDAQQLRIVQALAADLDVATEVVAVPTVRDPDGLALSSRNARLTPADRVQALALGRALFAAHARYASGVRDATALLATARTILDAADITTEYLVVVDERTFRPVEHLDRTALLLVAAPVGPVRLIDNVVLAAP